MIKKLATFFTAGSVAVLVAMGLAYPALANSAGGVKLFPACEGESNSKICQASGTEDRAQTVAQRILSLMFWVIGIASVIMIIVGGIKFTTSNGNAEQVKSAKNTILYAVVGLVVAIMGQAIVLFVANWLQGKQT